jgi:hypothetical protein
MGISRNKNSYRRKIAKAERDVDNKPHQIEMHKNIQDIVSQVLREKKEHK